MSLSLGLDGAACRSVLRMGSRAFVSLSTLLRIPQMGETPGSGVFRCSRGPGAGMLPPRFSELPALTMGRHEDFTRLVDRVYGAVGKPDNWRAFWQDLAVTLHASSATVIMQAPNAAGVDLQAGFAGGHQEHFEAYNGRFAALDPWFAAAARRGLAPSPQAFVGEHLVPLGQLRRSEFYEDFAKRFDMIRPLTIASADPYLFAVSVLRGERGKAWSEEDVQFVASLETHVRRAAEIHVRLHASDARSAALEDAFDRLTVGMVVLDGAGRVLFANRTARQFHADRDGFDLNGLRAGGTAPHGDTTIERAISKALTGGTIEPSDPVPLGRPSGRRPYAVTVSRCTSFSPELPFAAAVIVLIADPDYPPSVSTAALALGYALTPAEIEVTLAVAAGLSLSEIADARRVSIETVRAQLKTAMAKCGARRQSDLVRLVTTLAAVRPALQGDSTSRGSSRTSRARR
jgi:DNA-binding CsgD family transcriptional regulator/PAS domain-containing protein